MSFVLPLIRWWVLLPIRMRKRRMFTKFAFVEVEKMGYNEKGKVKV